MNKQKSLTPEFIEIIKDKKTECPFTGIYNDLEQEGSYLCRQCGIALFRSYHKFHSGCGWPSFDKEVESSIQQVSDSDGMRVEIVCNRCKAHLGHLFCGEKLTENNRRYCVNSLSLDFVADLKVTDTSEAILAGGCFWGIEYLFKQFPGVIKTEVGYTGGAIKYPHYQEVCTGTSGHVEAVRIIFDIEKTTFYKVIKYFLEIHDPTQRNGQGPDVGSQYLSIIFYYNEEQKKISQHLIYALIQKNYDVVTKILPVKIFWAAEAYHQNYYAKHKKMPYCHHYTARF